MEIKTKVLSRQITLASEEALVQLIKHTVKDLKNSIDLGIKNSDNDVIWVNGEPEFKLTICQSCEVRTFNWFERILNSVFKKKNKKMTISFDGKDFVKGIEEYTLLNIKHQ